MLARGIDDVVYQEPFFKKPGIKQLAFAGVPSRCICSFAMWCSEFRPSRDWRVVFPRRSQLQRVFSPARPPPSTEVIVDGLKQHSDSERAPGMAVIDRLDHSQARIY